MPKQLRIVYAIGSEDVIEAYKCWMKGEDVASQLSITNSSHFYEVCTALDAVGYVIVEANVSEVIRDERFIVERRRIPFANAKGVFYHLRQIWRGLQLCASAIRFRANVVIADSGTTYWFLLLPLCWLGINVIPSLHCTLWRKYSSQTFGEKVILELSRKLFSSLCHSIHAVSYEVADQVSQLTLGVHQPVYEFLPVYRRSDFADIPPPLLKPPLRILFAGRVECDKGAFDLLKIVERITFSGFKDIVVDVCGDGKALEALRACIKKDGIENFFMIHGHCNKQQMREMFGKSHAVIVPTRTDFIEGLNRVVAESILSGRPVITSAVCPALSYVREAVIEVPPNDIEAYAKAVLQLYNNPIIYEEKRLACLKFQEQFYDFSRSWGAALISSLSAIVQELNYKPHIAK
jgi:glycogen synthase